MLEPLSYDVVVTAAKDLMFKVFTGIHRAVYDLSSTDEVLAWLLTTPVAPAPSSTIPPRR